MKHNRHRYTLYIVLAALTGFVSCQHKEFDQYLPTGGNIPVNVIIHWGDELPNTLPAGMTVYWYPSKGGGAFITDMNRNGGMDWLYPEVFKTLCLDFYGNTNLNFRGDGLLETYEIYNARMIGLYNELVPQLPGEVTVAEAYPYYFFIDNQPQTVDAGNVPSGDTLTVHFYPKNILREFTFLVYDVIGGKAVSENGGAISGMSGSYYPASGLLAATPSTILFSRVETIKDAQTDRRWTDEQKALFTAKDPNWASPDTLAGWTRDWIVGRFCTFGPLDVSSNRFRLTVEVLTMAENHYHGMWGYWHGEWENTVGAQIDSAMGKNGTLEEQLAWRKRNGGYDIILYNDHRLVIPESEGVTPPDNNGGFSVNIDDWGDLIDVSTAGVETRRATSLPQWNPVAGVIRKSPENTAATVPDFVVNGIWSDASDWEWIFNEQYVYKTERGTWDYAPKKYWPQTGSIRFYAYAPAGIKNLGKGLRYNGDNVNPPVITYSMPLKEREEPPPGTGEPPSPVQVSDNQEDLLVAVQERSLPQIVAPNDSVPMNFKHAFSRITVWAKTDRAYMDRHIKVTRVDLRNVYTKGDLQLKPDNTGMDGIPMDTNKHYGNVTLWKSLDSLASYKFKLVSGEVAIADNYEDLVGNSNKIFIIPQIAEDKDVNGNVIQTGVYVEYNVYAVVGGKEVYQDSYGKWLPLPDKYMFKIGRQYALQVILDAP